MISFKDLLLKNKHSLVISLPVNNAAFARISWQEGADAVKVHINVSHRASGSIFGSFAEERDFLEQIISEAKGPCGIVPGTDIDVVERDYENVINTGFNFISLYAHDMPLSIINDERSVKMVAFDSSYDVSYLKYINKIGAGVLEASVMKPESYGKRLSAKDLMVYSELCENTSLPVLVPTQRNVLENEVKNLADCGVKATMIGAIVTGTTGETIKRAVAGFRNAIDKLK